MELPNLSNNHTWREECWTC